MCTYVWSSFAAVAFLARGRKGYKAAAAVWCCVRKRKERTFGGEIKNVWSGINSPPRPSSWLPCRRRRRRRRDLETGHSPKGSLVRGGGGGGPWGKGSFASVAQSQTLAFTHLRFPPDWLVSQQIQINRRNISSFLLRLVRDRTKEEATKARIKCLLFCRFVGGIGGGWA